MRFDSVRTNSPAPIEQQHRQAHLKDDQWLSAPPAREPESDPAGILQRRVDLDACAIATRAPG